MLLFCFSIHIQGQTSGIKGVITDETNIPLEMVSVALISPKDNSFLSLFLFTSCNNSEKEDQPFFAQIRLAVTHRGDW